MPTNSPTQKSLKYMQDKGYKCFIVEYWHCFAKIRKDLFGFVDILCLGNDEIIGVQVTSLSNVSARVKKIADHENTPFVRKAGIKILVHGWGKDKLREVDCS